MFFEKAEAVTIDGVKYELSMPVYNDTYNCKSCISEIHAKVDPDNFENECT